MGSFAFMCLGVVIGRDANRLLSCGWILLWSDAVVMSLVDIPG